MRPFACNWSWLWAKPRKRKRAKAREESKAKERARKKLMATVQIFLRAVAKSRRKARMKANLNAKWEAGKILDEILNCVVGGNGERMPTLNRKEQAEVFISCELLQISHTLNKYEIF